MINWQKRYYDNDDNYWVFVEYDANPEFVACLQSISSEQNWEWNYYFYQGDLLVDSIKTFSTIEEAYNDLITELSREGAKI